MATVGGVREVEATANNQEIVNLARFAVDEHNKKQQVVSGTLYDITLEAVEGGQKKLFEAKVWEKPWMQFKELKEFNTVAQSHSSTA
ncbi:hypothetical protein CISIN_1g034261mg [Citrus sinensis]|uniref:Cysteine proteinase inhibitor n=1 Tax=Citrus sinensis TaxID=2711 RepID=A0A067FSH4_CITSI|nr:hypothetical protein CISIN_1g034261mg [Citrus sinensis]